MQKIGLIVAASILFSCTTTILKKLKTPSENSNFTELTTNNELMEFLYTCDKLSEEIKVSVIGESIHHKSIPIVKIAKTDATDDKVTVFLFAQQHGNEPSGKEGLLLFINDFANGNNTELLDSINLLIMPQCNPEGGDKNKRTNDAGIDLNRDHLLLTSKESQLIQSVFQKYQPELSVDFHEYYPYGDSWKEFGYLRNFDIQLGGLTNSNIDEKIQLFMYNKALPLVKNELKKYNLSCSEYLLGNFSKGERLRRSTVDISDGRQSIGITNTISFIVEGKRGQDSIDLLEKRSKSQYITALALSRTAFINKTEILNKVHEKREALKLYNKVQVAIRMEHVKGDFPLHYNLLSIATKQDTMFVSEKYHSKVKVTLWVESPKGYLLPKKDTLLANWLARSNFSFHEQFDLKNSKIKKYQLLKVAQSVDEELENLYAEVLKENIDSIPNAADYYYVPVNQIYKYKIVTALEPQSMYGLCNYPEFNYLLNTTQFPILRVE